MTQHDNIQSAAICSLALIEKLQNMGKSGEIPAFSTETAVLLIGLNKDEVVDTQALLALMAIQGSHQAAIALFDLGIAIGLAAGSKGAKGGAA